MSRTQGNNGRQEAGRAFLETIMVSQNPPSLGCSCSFSAHSTPMKKRKVGILAHQTKEEDALLFSSADLTPRCRPHPPPMLLTPTGLSLLCSTDSLMDQSQWSVALEWRDITIPRWPDSFPGSYDFPRRTWIFKKHSSIAVEGNINPRECKPSKQAQGGYDVLQVNKGAPEGSCEYITDSSIPNLEWVSTFPKEKMISWTSVPETQIHYS